MSRRIVLSEEEKNEIKSKYGLLNEQSAGQFTIATIKDATYPEAAKKTYKIFNMKGNIKINGQMPSKGMTVTPNDKISMENGSYILFNTIPGFGQTTLDFYNSTPSLTVQTD